MHLKEMRIKKQITQTELASLIGVRANTISQYESGKREPNIETLRRLARALECTVDDLIV